MCREKCKLDYTLAVYNCMPDRLLYPFEAKLCPLGKKYFILLTRLKKFSKFNIRIKIVEYHENIINNMNNKYHVL